MSTENVEIGIIGGSGLYDPELLTNVKQIEIDTPYGSPSSSLTIGEYRGRKVAFLPRHGKKHTILPHLINYRANISAFKQIGVTRIIAVTATGSLRQDIAPGNFAIPSQFIDFTKTRIGTFSKIGNVYHVSTADPFCPHMQTIAYDLIKEKNVPVHKDVTYVCIEGPRFSTRSESKFFQSTGSDIIGMTLVPECQLAREAGICYVSVSMATDYDVWADTPVSNQEVLATFKKNISTIKSILGDLIEKTPIERTCQCEHSLDDAVSGS